MQNNFVRYLAWLRNAVSCFEELTEFKESAQESIWTYEEGSDRIVSDII
jgi:hypothetical protein